MTGAELKTLFEELVDDSSTSTDTVVAFFNAAKNEIESERDWEFLKKMDEASTVSAGDTYLTAKTLPADFFLPVKLFVGGDYAPYLQVPFEQRQRFKDAARRFYIDRASGTYYVCGSSAGTIHFCYLYETPDFTVSLTEAPVWPTRFHALIAYKAAMLFYAKDGGEKARAWDDRWQLYYNSLHDAMVNWDARLKIAGLENGSSDIDYTTLSNVVV